MTQFLNTVDRIFERSLWIHLVRPELVYLQQSIEIRVLRADVGQREYTTFKYSRSAPLSLSPLAETP